MCVKDLNKPGAYPAHKICLFNYQIKPMQIKKNTVKFDTTVL